MLNTATVVQNTRGCSLTWLIVSLQTAIFNSIVQIQDNVSMKHILVMQNAERGQEGQENLVDRGRCLLSAALRASAGLKTTGLV